VKSNSRPHKQFCYRQISPDTRNQRKRNAALQHDDGMFGPRRPQKTSTHYKTTRSGRLGRRQFNGVTLLLKATLPTCVSSRRELSLLQHAPRSSPYDTGAGPHASCKLVQGRRSQTAACRACNCLAVTSIPPLSPRPAGERVDSHTVGMEPRQVGVALRLQRAQHVGPGPHVMQPARRLLRASNCTATRSTTAPPRLRNQYRDSRKPCV
jgi:hypothetical protein